MLGRVVAEEVEVGVREIRLEADGLRHPDRFEQVEFQAGVAHVAAHRAVAAGIHHQAFERPVGLDAQVDPAMAHLHRAGQQ